MVKLIRCQTMNSSSATPPQRIVREEIEECLFFFTSYFTGRDWLARAANRAALATCTTKATRSTTRINQRSPL